MSYPGANIHRPSRRKLGRGQYPTALTVTCGITNPSADVLLLTFSRPVMVSGTIPVTSTSGAFVSQTVTSPTTVTQTWSATQAAATVTLPSNPANVATNPQGAVAGTTVTF